MHVLGEAFKKDANVNMTHIPFKGAAPLKQEMLAGRLQVGGDQLSSSLAELKAGTLKALATTASKRIAGLPDIPTVKELGFPNLELEGWNGVFAPAKTPKDIIDRLNKEMVALGKNPEHRAQLEKQGQEAVYSTPDELASYVKAESAKWGRVIKTAKIEAD
jgi:tripartite-type tricarboxylate transporter receptor subunit TctC